jgi:hypothetical protein
MSLTFPVSCSVGGHPSVLLHDDAELVTHYSSEHSAIPISKFHEQLKNADAPPQPLAAAATTTNTLSPYARFGLTQTLLSGVRSTDLGSAGDFSPALIEEFLSTFGDTHGIDVDPAHFYLDLFVFILRHGATDDPTGLGHLDLHDRSSSRTVRVTWENVKEAGVRFFTPLNMIFTFRKFVYALDDLFFAMWKDQKVGALDEIRIVGTPRSRNWRLPDGTAPPAYVLVPGLFNDKLTPAEFELRQRYRAAVNLDKGGVSRVDYVGIQNFREVDDDSVRAESVKSRVKASKLWQAAGGRAGVGAPDTSPGQDAMRPFSNMADYR